MPVAMGTKNTDSAAIDRVGTRTIMDHFALSASGVSQWRRRGIPKNYRKPMALLGHALGYEMPELPPVNFQNVG